jgi:branched-chain amino acid transport system substrate-binding protein
VAPLGTEQIRGIELAIERRGGLLLGHPIQLHTKDTGCTAEGGANAALKIIADPQMVAILGTTCSGAAATASKAMSDAGLAMISGNNSAPFLTAAAGKRAPHWQPGYFRTAPNEENAGAAAALYAFKKLGLSRAATINDGDLYTTGLTDGFINTFRQLGGQIVLSTSVHKGDTQMRPVLEAAINAKADLLFFPLFQPEGNRILLQAKKTPGLENITLMSDGALIESSFIKNVGAAARGMYFVGPARPAGPAVDKLAAAYKAKYGMEPATSYYVSAHDAAELLLTTLEKGAARASDGTLRIGRQALRQALYQTSGFEGAGGELTCNAHGDCAEAIFTVLRLDDPDAGVEGLQANIMFTHGPNQ